MEGHPQQQVPEKNVRSAWDHFHFCNKSPKVKEALCKWCTFRVLIPAEIHKVHTNDLQTFCKTAQSHLELHHPDMVLVALKNPVVLDFQPSSPSSQSTLVLDVNSQSAQDAQSSLQAIQAAVGKGLSLSFISGVSTQVPTTSRSTNSRSKRAKNLKTEKDESSKRTYNTRKASLPSYNFDNEEENSTSNDSDFSASGSRESSPDSLPSSKGSVKVVSVRSKTNKQLVTTPSNPPNDPVMNSAREQVLHRIKGGDQLTCTPIPFPLPLPKANMNQALFNHFNPPQGLIITPFSEKRKTVYHPTLPPKNTVILSQQSRPPYKLDAKGLSIQRTAVRHPATLTSRLISSVLRRPMPMKHLKIMPKMKPIKVPHKVYPKPLTENMAVLKQKLQGTKLTIVEFFKFERNPRSKRVGCFCRGCNRRLRYPKKRLMIDHLKKQHPEMLKYVQSPTKDPSSERILKSKVSATLTGAEKALSRKKTFEEWKKNPDEDDENILSDTSDSNADYESSSEETSEDEGADRRRKRSKKPKKTSRPVPSQKTIADNFYGLIRIKSEKQLQEEEPILEPPDNSTYATCLLCSGIVRPKPRARRTDAFKMWNKACSASLCELLNLNDSFQNIFETFPYCQHCEQLVQDIDFTYKSMKSLQKTLSGFQQRLDFILSSSYEMVLNPGVTPGWGPGREPPASYEEMISAIVHSVVNKIPAGGGDEYDPLGDQNFYNSFDDADVDDGLLQPEVLMETEDSQEMNSMGFLSEATHNNFQQRHDEIPIMFTIPEDEPEMDRDPLDTKPAFLTSEETLPNEPTIVNTFSVNSTFQNSSEERYTAEDVNLPPICKTEISVDPIFETNSNKANIHNDVIVMNQPLFADDFSVDPIFEIIPSQPGNQPVSSGGISVNPIFSNVGRNFEETDEQAVTNDSLKFEVASNTPDSLEETVQFSVFPILENQLIPSTSQDSNHFEETGTFVIRNPVSGEDAEPIVVKIEPN